MLGGGPPDTTTVGRLAQLVEQLTLNQRVDGSSPSSPTNLFSTLLFSGKREWCACGSFAGGTVISPSNDNKFGL